MNQIYSYLSCLILLAGLLPAGCFERTPVTAQCPVSYESKLFRICGCGYDGVDILVVLDNAESMKDKEDRIAASLSTLVDQLSNPWDYPELSAATVWGFRLAVVTTDMGRQWADLRDVYNVITGSGPSSEGIAGCTELGDDARFQGIDCVAGDAGILDKDEGAEFSAAGECYAKSPDTTECPLPQAFNAVSRVLTESNTHEFGRYGRLLGLLFISDKDDYSVADETLFHSPPWAGDTGIDPRAACAIPENPSLLSVTAPITGKDYGVLSLIIAGFPSEAESPCEGFAQRTVVKCLESDAMTPRLESVESENGATSIRLGAACTEMDDAGTIVSRAEPGRRYAALAQEMPNYVGNAYLYSICNQDWTPAVTRFSNMILQEAFELEYPYQEPWTLLSRQERDEMECDNCGHAMMDIVFEKVTGPDEADGDSCPASLYAHLPPEERDYYLSRTTVEMDPNFPPLWKKIHCIVPRLNTPLLCGEADAYAKTHYRDAVGWYYCRNAEETPETCADGQDNDNNSYRDCDDLKCLRFEVCGGWDDGEYYWNQGVRIRYTPNVEFIGWVDYAKAIVKTPNNEDCSETGRTACNDNIDNDGDDKWDCEDTSQNKEAALPHFAAPSCCPMTVDADGNCVVDLDGLEDSCNSREWQTVGACKAMQDLLSCKG